MGLILCSVLMMEGGLEEKEKSLIAGAAQDPPTTRPSMF